MVESEEEKRITEEQEPHTTTQHKRGTTYKFPSTPASANLMLGSKKYKDRPFKTILQEIAGNQFGRHPNKQAIEARYKELEAMMQWKNASIEPMTTRRTLTGQIVNDHQASEDTKVEWLIRKPNDWTPNDDDNAEHIARQWTTAIHDDDASQVVMKCLAKEAFNEMCTGEAKADQQARSFLDRHISNRLQSWSAGFCKSTQFDEAVKDVTRIQQQDEESTKEIWDKLKPLMEQWQDERKDKVIKDIAEGVCKEVEKNLRDGLYRDLKTDIIAMQGKPATSNITSRPSVTLPSTTSERSRRVTTGQLWTTPRKETALANMDPRGTETIKVDVSKPSHNLKLQKNITKHGHRHKNKRTALALRKTDKTSGHVPNNGKFPR
ncbi:uncharacterized protein BCR38DRAFT_406836 [Pseudomassariella vexata]|uniref:Uncharacterized protein n=1 Tax=Pseudomassariella vexata TaxID=1141098 RepID=A0A1Y2EBL4_9PEZI|nr:uncharacterized protein BCR38DRAFT_406836 [Pseudomassariella vexata]ORY68959.1 hypothetical protein BCR38DRAFT_406836 [Pseudomassariella vexata]